MQFSTHETDLYILPETREEKKDLIDLLEKKFPSWKWYFNISDVEGQNWYKKLFIEIPFGIDLKEEITKYFK